MTPSSELSRAVVFRGPETPLSIEPFPPPQLEPGEVLARVTCCTLCGSDVHTYQGRRTTPVPTVLGHEILGEVQAFGPGPPLKDFAGHALQVGDRITWSIAASCGKCFFCIRDIPQKCESLIKYGHERIEANQAFRGGLAELCHLAAGTAILRIPDSIPDAVACPVNCATATVAAALRVGEGVEGQKVLIQGGGMLGLTACAMAKSRGADAVIVCDVAPDRLETARQFGATSLVQVTDNADAFVATIQKQTEGRGVDLALEMSGAASAVEFGLASLRIGGRYVLIGSTFPTRPVSIEPEIMVRRLLQIRGNHNYTPRDLLDAVEFLGQYGQEYPFAELVYDGYPLDETEAAFRHATDSRSLRVAVRPGGQLH